MTQSVQADARARGAAVLFESRRAVRCQCQIVQRLRLNAGAAGAPVRCTVAASLSRKDGLCTIAGPSPLAWWSNGRSLCLRHVGHVVVIEHSQSALTRSLHWQLKLPHSCVTCCHGSTSQQSHHDRQPKWHRPSRTLTRRMYSTQRPPHSRLSPMLVPASSTRSSEGRSEGDGALLRSCSSRSWGDAGTRPPP